MSEQLTLINYDVLTELIAAARTVARRRSELSAGTRILALDPELKALAVAISHVDDLTARSKRSDRAPRQDGAA